MRILHTSDWHLGQFFYAKSRANEHQQFIQWLVAQVVEQQIDAVIIAGDIFDTGAPPSYAREMYFDFIATLHQHNCQLVIVAGNHDSVAMLGESQGLLEKFNTHVIPAVTDKINKQVFALKNKAGEASAVICAIPFIRPRDVIKSQAGQSAKDKNQSLQQAINQHYQHLFAHAQTLVQKHLDESTDNETLPIIATGHLTALGVTSSDSVRDIYIGTLEAFPASDFPSADYIALGHIHQPQKIAKTEHIRYCGSPIPLSFDELNYDKKVLMVDFKASDEIAAKSEQQVITEITEIAIPRFQPMALLRTSLEKLDGAVKSLCENRHEEGGIQATLAQPMWLAIEIETAEYLSDLSQRIEAMTAQYPVEVLLIKRQSTRSKVMATEEDNITLAELSVEDVFTARLSQENWETDDALAQKSRLETLFKQTLEHMNSGEGEPTSATSNTAPSSTASSGTAPSNKAQSSDAALTQEQDA